MDRVPKVQANSTGPRIDYATKFKITEETLLSLAAVGVPEPVTAKLKPMKDKEFDSQDAFLRALSGTLDDQELKLFRNQVLNHTDRTEKEIEFHNVCFSYQPGKPTLENISFKVRAGETIAIVGPNGCGKTTLLNLLPRFYDPDHGTILIDGIDLRNAHLRSLRKQIGVVTQDTILFDDTIYNNIAYGSPGATTKEIEAVAKNAFAHEFIMEAPLGYQTQIGEMRVVSGGEKQRIALARAMLRDPSILILDEFTSSIDAVSDSLIHAALKEFVKGRTTFLITHKMHTLEIADRIIVLNRGNIEAIGTHTEFNDDIAIVSQSTGSEWPTRGGVRIEMNSPLRNAFVLLLLCLALFFRDLDGKDLFNSHEAQGTQVPSKCSTPVPGGYRISTMGKPISRNHPAIIGWWPG